MPRGVRVARAGQVHRVAVEGALAAGPHEAVVLAGGTARRLGGVDKPGLRVGGRALLDRVLDACPPRVVVAGPPRLARHRGELVWVREDPPGGGPVAGLVAALPLLRGPLVAVLGADLPFLSRPALGTLAAATRGYAGALALDDDDRDQPLLAVWWLDALAAVLPVAPAGAGLRDVVGSAHLARVHLRGRPPPWWDCDTPAALARARAWAGEAPWPEEPAGHGVQAGPAGEAGGP